MVMARSNATHDITRPYTNGCRPPRVSQIPSSGWSHDRHSQFMSVTRLSHPWTLAAMPCEYARATACIASP